MTEEKSIRRFVIRKFIVTLVLVGVAEFVLLDFINHVLLPLMVDAFYPELQGFKLLSPSNIVLASLLIIFYLLSLLLNKFFPAAGGFLMSGISNALGYYGIGGVNNPLQNLTQKEFAMLVLTLVAVLALVVLPFVVGAVIFSGQVARKLGDLEQSRVAERQQNERKRYLMISDIAHDLKTPMTTVSGYARALSEGMVGKDQEKEYLDAITAKTERMNDIVQMLFDYVRLDSEGFDLVKSSVDICEFVREVVSSLYQDIEDKGDELDVDIPDGPVKIDIDKLQFSRVLNNLLTNAVKHNEAGTKIGVSVRVEPDEVRIYIADSGDKIADELAADVFDPFVMGDASRGTGGGSGLGLAVTKKIVEMHGFKVKLVQAPDIARYELGSEYKKVFVIVMNGEFVRSTKSSM